MGSVCLFFIFIFFRDYFLGGRLPVFRRAVNNHVLCSWVQYSWADDMVQVAKNEMWASEVCFACLT